MTFEELIQEFCAAVEAGDGTRLGALFTPTGIYHDTFYGEYQGPEAIRGMLEERFYGDAKDFLWEMTDLSANERVGYTRWTFSYTSTMAEAEGKRVVFQGMSCFELEGGKIRKYNENFDAGKALVQLDFPIARVEKILRRGAEEMRNAPGGGHHLSGRRG